MCGEELLAKRFACKKYSIKDQLNNLHRPHFNRKDLIEDKCLLPKTSYNETTHTFEPIPSKYSIFPVTQLARFKNNIKSEAPQASIHNELRSNSKINTSDVIDDNFINNNSQQSLHESQNEVIKEEIQIKRKTSDEKILEIKISSDTESSSSKKNKSFGSNKTFSIEYPTKFEALEHERSVHLPDISLDSKSSKTINIECVELRLPIRKETVIKIFSDNSIQIKPINTSQNVSESMKTIELNFNNTNKDSHDKIQILNIICRS